MTSRITEFCVDHLLTHGPASLDDLAAAARAASVTQARFPQQSMRTTFVHDVRFLCLPDDTWDLGLRLLEGSVLTHRVRHGTAGRGLLFPGPSLAPLKPFVRKAPLALAPEGEARNSAGYVPAWTVPSGWLPAVPAGSLLALRWSQRRLSVEPVVLDPEQLTEQIEVVRVALERHAETRRNQVLDPEARVTAALWSALVEVPDLLADPLPPLDEILPLAQAPRPSVWEQSPASSDGTAAYGSAPYARRSGGWWDDEGRWNDDRAFDGDHAEGATWPAESARPDEPHLRLATDDL